MAAQSTLRPFNFLLIGNPGVGKSTILNGMIGTFTFKSGVSYGKGLTYQLDKQRPEGQPHTFMDTPGLADTQMREQAATAITEALKQSGHYKIFFVMTLEAGRVRPADVTTMKLVLEAAPITSYGIILNQLSAKMYKDLQENPRKENPSPEECVQRSLWGTLPQDRWTTHIHYVKRYDEYEGENDVVPDLPNDLLGFIHGLPGMVIDPQKVTGVKDADFEKLNQQNEAILREMREQNRGLQEALNLTKDQVNVLTRQVEEQRQERARWEARMEDMKEQYQRQMETLRQEREVADKEARDAQVRSEHAQRDFNEQLRLRQQAAEDESMRQLRAQVQAEAARAEEQRRAADRLRQQYEAEKRKGPVTKTLEWFGIL